MQMIMHVLNLYIIKSRRACEEWESEKTALDLSAGRTREEREVKEQLQS